MNEHAEPVIFYTLMSALAIQLTRLLGIMETLQRWTYKQMDRWIDGKTACQIYIFHDLCYSYNPYGIIIFKILNIQF